MMERLTLALPRGSVRPAMHGDRVLVAAEPYTRGGLQRGSICEVLERAHTSIIGVVHSVAPYRRTSMRNAASDCPTIGASHRHGDPQMAANG